MEKILEKESVNILLTLAYDGTNYCGWQNQKNGVAVQQRLEEGLKMLFKTDISVLGASRTDAGVHALGQRAMFSLHNKKQDKNVRIPLNKLPYAINAHLPKDIIVSKAEIVPDDFNPIFCAKRKTYEYRIYYAPFMNPMLHNQCCYVNHHLDLNLMNDSISHFIGEHDFKAFCASGATTKTSVRTIYSLKIDTDYCYNCYKDEGANIFIRICGNGFLYNMVRIIAGTLIYVGEGKITPSEIPNIILKKKRELAGKTAPPQGLTLMNVEY